MTSETPYPGLRSFRSHEVDIFFGRDDHIDEMIDKLAKMHFLCITGPSGCGKSSLARTGLMNGLESGFLSGRGSDWVFVDMRPGNDPLATLFQRFAEAVAPQSGDNGGPNDGTATPPERVAQIRQLLANHVARRSHDLTAAIELIQGLAERPILILIDQFEELFRYAQKDSRTAVTFVDVLLQTIAAAKNIYVAITIRTDELEKCSRYPGLTLAINNSQFLTPMLDRFQIQEAIEGPISVFAGTIDSELIVWLLNSVEDELDKLPLLQHTLKLLYQYKCDQGLAGHPDVPVHPDDEMPCQHATIGLRDFISCFSLDPSLDAADMQGRNVLRHILSGRLDAIYFSLPPSLQPGAQRLFCALTSSDTGKRDIRRAPTLDELERTINLSRHDTQSIIAAFSQGSDTYLQVTRNTQEPNLDTVDVTHECVLRLWSRLSDEWLRDERSSTDNIRYLAQSAKNYEDGMRRNAFLGWLWGENTLSGGTLKHYSDWFSKAEPTPTWAARHLSDISWLDKSQTTHLSPELIFQEVTHFLSVCRRRQKFLRASSLGVVVAILLCAGGLAALLAMKNRSLEEADRTTSAITALLGPPKPQENDRTDKDAGRECSGQSEFCRSIATARTVRFSIDELRKYDQTPACPADAVYRSVAPISNLTSGECAQFSAVVQGTPMNPDVGDDYTTSFVIAKQIAANASNQSLARPLFSAISAKNPYTPVVFRYLGDAYLEDSTVPQERRFSEGGTCLRRAMDLSCQNQLDIYDLYFSVYALDDFFDTFNLKQQRVILLLSLSRALLPREPRASQKPSVDEIQRLWRGAQPAAEAARLIAQTHGCNAKLSNQPMSANATASSEPACALVKSLYERAAHAWGDMLQLANTTEVDDAARLQVIFGAGLVGLFWGQDAEFRQLASGLIDQTALGKWLLQGAEDRKLPRYFSGLAMLSCLQGRYDDAKQYASKIVSDDEKYLEIKRKVAGCETSTDLANLFNRTTISE